MNHARIFMLLSRYIPAGRRNLPEQEEIEQRLTAMKTEETWIHYAPLLIIIIIIIIIIIRVKRKSF